MDLLAQFDGWVSLGYPVFSQQKACGIRNIFYKILRLIKMQCIL
jgi:hypothetical protein